VVNWRTPQSVKDLRSFLGLAGCYRKFVRNFGVIAKPLTELLKKNTLFIWTSSHDQSFQALKQALNSSTVLALPESSSPLSIETNPSASGIGAVLTQEGHPLAFLSKALGPRSRGLSTYEKEYMAVLMAVQQWRSYLQHAEFTIFTDQQSLVQLTDQHLHTMWQQKLFSKLVGLQFRIVYKLGTANQVADALSCKSFHDSACAAISVVAPTWIQEVVSGYAADPTSSEMIAKLTIDSAAVPGFSLWDGVLHRGPRIWIGDNKVLQQKILHAIHSSALGSFWIFGNVYSVETDIPVAWHEI